MAILLFLVLHWYLSLFAQTFFHHRYGAHKMFLMTPFWEKFFFIFTWITQGSSYLNPRAYAIMHRMHHAYSDTEKDPHSPHYFRDAFQMIWRTKDYYYALVSHQVEPEARFDKNYPTWPKLERIAESSASRYLFAAGYILFYVFFATQWWMWLFLPIHFFMGPIQGAIVNWAGHKYGYTNFKDGDHSKNTLFIDFLLLGELFQNNHHHFAARSNFATRWWEFDPVYPIIRLLDTLGIVKIVRAT